MTEQIALNIFIVGAGFLFFALGILVLAFAVMIIRGK